MSLMDFNPNRYVVLNWLALTKLAYPDLDWSDKADVLYKTKVLLESIELYMSGSYLTFKSSISREKAAGNAGLVRIVNHFVFDGRKFFETDDGSFLCGTPEVDERLIKLYWPEVEERVIPALSKVDIEYFDENAMVI